MRRPCMACGKVDCPFKDRSKESMGDSKKWDLDNRTNMAPEAEDLSRMTVLYGGAPDPSWPYPGRPTPNTPTFPSIGTGVTISPPGREKQKVTVAARIDEDGKLWLRLSVDGVHVAEVEGSTTATFTVEV